MTDEPQSDLTDAEKLAAFADLCIYAEAVTAENEWLREQVRLRDDAIAGLKRLTSSGFIRATPEPGFAEKRAKAVAVKMAARRAVEGGL